MKYLIATLTVTVLLVGHVIYGLHKVKTEGQITEAMRVLGGVK